jgi:NitT/TauT family transport system ATP-binding protein
MYDIKIENLSFSYDQSLVLDNISLDIRSGDFFCLLGASGSGKSTLLKLIAGLMKPDSGSIRVNGSSIDGPGLDRGVVFQDYSLFPWMSTGENLSLAIHQAHPKIKSREAYALASDYLELVGLPDAYGRLPGELSGGMRQRAAIARMFAINSPIQLLDEPFGALDPITRARLQDLLLQLWQNSANGENRTVLFITHDVEEALVLANRIAILGLNPGTVKEVVSVDLPRPRKRSEVYHKPEFQELRNHLVDVMHEDVISQLDAEQTVFPLGDRI